MKTLPTTAISIFKKAVLLFTFTFFAMLANAQTYTSQSDGMWSSPTTWAGGVVPPATISAGVTVNINHTVTINNNNDLVISGTLKVTGDTLVLGSSFVSKNIRVLSTGQLRVANGGITYNAAGASTSISAEGGKIVFENATVNIPRDFLATQGAARKVLNSTVKIGGKYDLDGTLLNPSADTLKFSFIETNLTQAGDFYIHNNTTLRVANAYIKVNNGNNFRNDIGGKIQVLTDASRNTGFDYLKVTKDLINDGSWSARIDAACITSNISGVQIADIDFTRSQDCSNTPQIGAAPELIFKDPVLVSGTPNKQGAIYRFANVTTGVDAQIRLKKFSRNDILMKNADLDSLGWQKAFQPQFGLSGNVAPNQNWYIDFELKFYEAGTNTIKVMPKVDMTALDVDGDGVSITEYASFQNPSNVSYSTINNLMEQTTNLVGQTFTCLTDNIPTLLISCTTCGGDGKTGIWNLAECNTCEGTGILHAGCHHAFEGVNASHINGPVTNFVNIDTAATQVMAVYQFTDRSVINFRYGAKSGSASSSAGIRLNSLWFRQFSLAPVITVVLPVKLFSFTATLGEQNKALLKWTTATETNLSHFVVERSTDGVNYTDAGIVFALGNTTEQSSYNLADNLSGITSSIVYYRLRSIDNDGKNSLSEVRIIRLNKTSSHTISIQTYPNPVTTDLRITIPADWQNKKVVYEAISLGGQVLKRVEMANSSQTEVMGVSSLAPGMYIIRVTCQGQTAQQKVVKQ